MVRLNGEGGRVKQPYVILHHPAGALPADPPVAFTCSAVDADDAEAQYMRQHAGEVVWILQSDDAEQTFSDYWGASIEAP